MRPPARPPRCATRPDAARVAAPSLYGLVAAVVTLHAVIVYHGTTIENKESIEREGLRPNSYVASTLELAQRVGAHARAGARLATAS